MDVGKEAGPLPDQILLVGGKGTDGNLYPLKTGTDGSIATTASEPVGAANLSTTQVTASTTASTLAIARPTRTSVLFRNIDSTISVYIGKATVSSSNGTLLKAGESVSFTSVGLIQVIAASGSPIVSVADEYN